jgi:redox-sensing transcriptional repressor
VKNIDKKYIPQETARRLSLYLRSLRGLEKKKKTIASSEEIVKFLDISSVQFRKDLSYFGGFGRRGVGYNVDVLKKEIGKILGTDVVWKIALVGVGKLGSALLRYPGFLEFNLKIEAAFDNDPHKIGRVLEGVTVKDIRGLKSFISHKEIKIAILSVSAEAAQRVSQELVGCGVKAILNFSPVNLLLPQEVFVSNVDMASELESLVYKLKRGGAGFNGTDH